MFRPFLVFKIFITCVKLEKNMYNKAPKNYVCPFCELVIDSQKKIKNKNLARIFYQDKFITAFISSHWWPNNKGHILIIPNKHIENIYSLPDYMSDKIHRFEKRAALAIKAVYNCDGVSSRQHNESAGNQDVWHYHLHLFPRYDNDNLYQLHSKKFVADEKEVKYFANKLRKYFNKN